MFYSELKIPRGTHCCLEMEPSSIEELIDSHIMVHCSRTCQPLLPGGVLGPTLVFQLWLTDCFEGGRRSCELQLQEL